MKKIKQYHIELFRFQLLPIDKNIQLSLIDLEINDYESLVKHKNVLLERILVNENINLQGKKSQVVFRLEYQSETYFIFRIGVKRILIRNTSDFKKEEIENYPNIQVIINTDPKIQTIGIERNYKAFGQTETASHILENSLMNYLQKYHLAIYIEPIYQEREFWNIIEKYSERIQKLSFDLIRPNMSNISSKIDEQIKKMQLETNSHKTKIEFESNIDSNLIVEKSNEQLENLIDYASKGGGPISLKVKGLSRRIKTSKSTETYTLNELDYNGPKDKLLKILKGFGF